MTQLLHKVVVLCAIRKVLPFNRNDALADLREVWQPDVAPFRGRPHIDQDGIGVCPQRGV